LRGWNHIVEEHFNPSKGGKSQFEISQAELRALLQAREVVRAPIVRVLRSDNGPRYLREVIFEGRIIGVDATTKSPTSILTVMTDEFGNLVTTFPGRIPWK
jgi:filamentous hemagglutinin